VNPRIYRVAGYGLLALAVALIGYDRSSRSRAGLDNGAGSEAAQRLSAAGLNHQIQRELVRRGVDHDDILPLLPSILRWYQSGDPIANFHASQFAGARHPEDAQEPLAPVDARIRAMSPEDTIAAILAVSGAKPGDAMFDSAKDRARNPSLYNELELRRNTCCGLLAALARKDPGQAFALIDKVAGDLNALDPATAGRVKGDGDFWMGLGKGEAVIQIAVGAAAADPALALNWYGEHRTDPAFGGSQAQALTGIMKEAAGRNVSQALEEVPQLDPSDQYNAVRGITQGLQTPGDRMDLIAGLRRKTDSLTPDFAAQALQQTGFAAATADGAAEAWNWLDHASLTADERKAIDAGIELMTESCSLIDPKHPSPSNKDMDRFQRHQFLLHGQ
jgi:hypothetical protein